MKRLEVYREYSDKIKLEREFNLMTADEIISNLNSSDLYIVAIKERVADDLFTTETVLRSSVDPRTWSEVESITDSGMDKANQMNQYWIQKTLNAKTMSISQAPLGYQWKIV